MRSFALCIAYILLINLAFCQKVILDSCKECNYINDYYPLIYKAQLKYLQEDLDSAFQYISKAKEKCELLNTPDILERVMYAEILIDRKNYNDALESLEELIRVGFPFEFLEYNEALKILKQNRKWEDLRKLSLQINARENNFFNWKLRDEILEMVKVDQLIRRSNMDYEERQKIDSVHQKRIKEIFETYGYPNEKLIGFRKPNERVDITIMLMHFNDLKYFKPKLLGFIKKGDCNPYTMASIVDSNDRQNKLYTYGIYSSVDSTQIIDFPNLNSRRKALGLRTLENHVKTMALIEKKYKSK